MSQATHQVRIGNITRARDVWRLKMDGLSEANIAEKVSSTEDIVKNILKHTTFSYYASLVKEEVSYYDIKVTTTREISENRKELRAIIDTIAYKRKIFLRIFEITAVVIAFLIVI